MSETRHPQRELARELAAGIRAGREARGWTRVRAAREVGVSTGHLANLEAGRRVPSLALAADLIAVLELPADIAERLTEVAAPAAGRSSPYALGRRWSHERHVPPSVPVTVWAARQRSNVEEIGESLDVGDRRQLRALRAAAVARALDELERWP